MRKAFIRRKFQSFPTIGVKIEKLESPNYNMNVWDIGGQAHPIYDKSFNLKITCLSISYQIYFLKN
ncbi:ADP-ribosylation factor-like protein [Candidatus Harpocratesius sp.]